MESRYAGAEAAALGGVESRYAGAEAAALGGVGPYRPQA
jgi:hypothetical protein